ncbi:PadR family transcriptional regulator [Thermogemmatispora tikiterensis]|nr:PadR family transcriptional regulator [Thermogemmatispora tikiterensis]
MHKILLLLGLLRLRPMYGYELHQIIQAHGELYSDLKKANLYYLLERLAKEGYLRVQAMPGARGSRGERLIYDITDQGRKRFNELLHEIMLNYEPVHIGVETAVIFLEQVPTSEAIALLVKRREIVAEHRTKVAKQLETIRGSGPMMHIASDHLLSLIDAELAWIDRSVTYLLRLEDASKPRHQRRVAETE